MSTFIIETSKVKNFLVVFDEFCTSLLSAFANVTFVIFFIINAFINVYCYFLDD